MNCFIVSLGCAMDDYVIGVCATEDEAVRLAKDVADDPDSHLDKANEVYARDASVMHVVHILIVVDGKVVGVRNQHDLDEADVAA